MLFSIIIPEYNRAKTLPTCLDSVISQDFDDFECIRNDTNQALFVSKLIQITRLYLFLIIHVSESFGSLLFCLK